MLELHALLHYNAIFSTSKSPLVPISEHTYIYVSIFGVFVLVVIKKQVNMIRKYHNHKRQTNPHNHKEEPQNINKPPERQLE